MGLELLSYDVVNVEVGREESLVVSDAGEVVLVGWEENRRPTLTYFAHTQHQARRVENVFTLGPINQHKLVRTDKQEFTYYSSGSSILAIDNRSHKQVLEWSIGEEVTAFDAVWSRSGGVLVVAATIGDRLCVFANNCELGGGKPVQGSILSVMIVQEEG